MTIFELLDILSDAYRVELSDNARTAYLMVLNDLEIDLLKTAVMHAMALDTTMPKPARLREIALGLQVKATAGDRLTAGEAWAEVTRAISIYGYARRPELSPEIWKAVEALGGWRYVCLSENIMVDRAHFRKIWENLTERQREEQLTLPAVSAAVKQLAGKLSMNQKQLKG